MKLFERLNRINDPTASETKLINYILLNSENIVQMTIYDLAKNTNISPPTIVRFCKKCGYLGFKDLKISLIQSLDEQMNSIKKVDANIPFKETDTDLMISKEICQLSLETIQATFNLLSTRKLNSSVTQIISAENIYAVGVSDNYLRLSDFQVKLLQINLYVRMIGFQAEQYQLARASGPKDVALIVSYSGRTAEIVNDAKQFRMNHTPIIAITSDENSPLAMLSNEIFLLPNKENTQVSVANFSSHLAIEYILNSLYACIFNRNYKVNSSKKANTPVAKFL